MCSQINAQNCSKFYQTAEANKSINSLTQVENNYGFFSEAFNADLPEGLYIYVINSAGHILVAPRTLLLNNELKIVGHTSLLNRLHSLNLSTDITAAGEFIFKEKKISYLNNKSGFYKKGTQSLDLSINSFKQDYRLSSLLNSTIELQDYSTLQSLTSHPLYVQNSYFDPAHTISISEIIGKSTLENILLQKIDVIANIQKTIAKLKHDDHLSSDFLEVQQLTGAYVSTENSHKVLNLLKKIGHFKSDGEFIGHAVNEYNFSQYKGKRPIFMTYKYCDFILNVRDSSGKINHTPVRLYTTASIHLEIESAVAQAFGSADFLHYKEKGAIGVKVSGGGKVYYSEPLKKHSDYKGDNLNVSLLKLKKWNP